MGKKRKNRPAYVTYFKYNYSKPFIERYFPYLGLGVSLIIVSTLVLLFKQKLNYYEKLIYLISLVLSFFIFYRANPFLVFLNSMASIYAISLLSLNNNWRKNLGVLRLVFLPIILSFRVLLTPTKHKIIKLFKGSHLKTSQSQANDLIVGGMITFVVLLVVVPLLSYANPIFSNLIGNIFEALNFLENINEQFFIYFLRVLLFIFLMLILPKLATFVEEPSVKLSKQEKGSLSRILLIPKLALLSIISVFFVTQLQLYFSTEQT